MRTKQDGFSVVELLLIIVVVAILTCTGWFVYHATQSANSTLNAANKSTSAVIKTTKVTDFASCKKAAGSVSHETYPETCVTKNGKKFTDASTQRYLVIKEWGVKLELNDSVLADAVYGTPKTVASEAPGVEAVLLATKDTLSFDYTCGEQSGEGNEPVSHTVSSDQDYLHRAKTAEDLSQVSNRPPSEFIRIGEYYYIYDHNTGHGNCEPTDAKIGEKARAVGNAYSNAKLLAE